MAIRKVPEKTPDEKYVSEVDTAHDMASALTTWLGIIGLEGLQERAQVICDDLEVVFKEREFEVERGR